MRPDQVPAAENLIQSLYPPFLQQDPVAAAHWGGLYEGALARFQTMAADDVGEIVAVGNSIPFPWHGNAGLPDEGWDAVLRLGSAGTRADWSGWALSALSIVVHPAWRGAGVAEHMLAAMQATAARAGLAAFVAPVRPTRKAEYPLHAFEQYCSWRRPDGSPFDPWIRTHWQLGAAIVRPAMRSMTIPASLDAWQEWTGLRFPESGPYWFPGGLAPLQVNLERGEAVYVEPNLWMRHQLG
jgi:GNAT superfamily N-acetyltransferase